MINAEFNSGRRGTLTQSALMETKVSVFGVLQRPFLVLKTNSPTKD
jgi:hypothetical protein